MLSGVLTLSTCSNVCLLTDYPFTLKPSAHDPAFAHDYAQAMGQIPLSRGLTQTLSVGARPGELVVEATAVPEAGHRQHCFSTPLDNADFGKPQLRVGGRKTAGRTVSCQRWLGRRGARFAWSNGHAGTGE
ncbi:Uncharacterized protein predicted to be involved in C-type cytochrome biogenesis [Citrobacter koseri]|uniref:Uncharacterized protein predicted to be involved in C-type cytochrome biogenesis n=1 Tax=Citrobacter koseri TaxID=545 RepID=A0A2X2XNH4_CITKO|nr:Uncharacterized protein predicted to be involved in C-type cytochrome biogenesis [Citrobacter koseri]